MDCLAVLHFILYLPTHCIHTAGSTPLPVSLTFSTLIESRTQVARALNANGSVLLGWVALVRAELTYNKTIEDVLNVHSCVQFIEEENNMYLS